MPKKRLGVWLGLALALGCRCESPEPLGKPEKQAVVAVPVGPTPQTPQRLAELDLPAYGHVLALDGAATFLLTASAVYRWEGGGPPELRALDLGLGPVLTPSGIVYWSRGAFRRAPKTVSKSSTATEPEVLALVPHQPQTLVASGERFAWLSRSDDGRHSIEAFRGSWPRTLYAAGGTIDVVCMHEESVYFAERNADGTWRFGRVRPEGKPVFSVAHTGRTPPMLVPADDGIYYYDGPRFEVRRLSFDLLGDEQVVGERVCSPLGLGPELYCSSVEGLFAVKKDGGGARLLVPGRDAQITQLVAGAGRLAWLSDRGASRLALDELPWPASPNPPSP